MFNIFSIHDVCLYNHRHRRESTNRVFLNYGNIFKSYGKKIAKPTHVKIVYAPVNF